jgi:NAD(P)-dependent dehydrogenase (short-subunit alcohol dehydrogenase family)
MTTPQHPINSGFDRGSTVEDVLAGIDLSGQLAVVTGGYSGIGLEDVRGMSARGATVVVPARRPDIAREQLHGIDRVEIAELDLTDLDSVRVFADDMLASGRPIDVLINSAGIMGPPETRVAHGWELQFAANHLGHFALTNRLWPALAAEGGARVVAVSSRGHKFGQIRWDDLEFREGYDAYQAYGQSKRANVLFAVELDRLGAGAGVRAFSLHPGGIRTNLQRYMSPQDQERLGWYDDDGNLVIHFKTPAQGAATSAWAATSPQLDGMGGVYCEDCDIAELVESGANPMTGVDADAVDPELAARLWSVSAQLTGVDAFAAV